MWTFSLRHLKVVRKWGINVKTEICLEGRWFGHVTGTIMASDICCRSFSIVFSQYLRNRPRFFLGQTLIIYIPTVCIYVCVSTLVVSVVMIYDHLFGSYISCRYFLQFLYNGFRCDCRPSLGCL